jgi:hypothetical protein
VRHSGITPPPLQGNYLALKLNKLPAFANRIELCDLSLCLRNIHIAKATASSVPCALQ